MYDEGEEEYFDEETDDGVYNPNSSYLEDLDEAPRDPRDYIYVNKDRVRQYIVNVQDFIDKPSSQRVLKNSESLVKDLADAYVNTNAKIILNWGKNFAPIFEDFGELTESVQVGKQCDQQCAVDCYRPDFYKNQYEPFDLQCLLACNCTFKINDSDK